MDPWVWVAVLIAGAALAFVAWDSFQSLTQAGLLRRCARASLSGLAGRPAALRGKVKVHEVVRIAHLGDCLWHRELVQSCARFGRRRTWRTESDQSTMADFSVLIGGEEVRVVGEPTEIQGKKSDTVKEGAGFVGQFFGERDERVTDEWIPILDEITIVGRLQHTGRGWEIGKDSKAGLFMSPDDPAGAARRESIKGVLGLAATVTGLLTMVYLYFKLSP